MINNEQIQKEIEKTLESLDGIKRAEANSFLFTRIKAKMQKQDSQWEERTFSFLSRPAIAFAIVVLVMAVNAWAVWGGSSSGENPANDIVASELASEYNTVASVTNYDYENDNQ